MTRRPPSLPLVAIALTVAAACERETRRYDDPPASPARADTVRLTPLQPGGPQAQEIPSPYQENAYGIAEGKQLFVQYNCNGCHAMGGGAIGPALLDDKWIYGAGAGQIYSSIAQGRPNGMPSFAGHVPDQQIWQLVAYVQSLSGAVPKDAAPGRADDLSAKEAENRRERERPKQTGHR